MPQGKLVYKNGRVQEELIFSDELDSPGYQSYLNKLKRKKAPTGRKHMLRDVAFDHEEQDSKHTDPFGHDCNDNRRQEGLYGDDYF